MSDSPSIKKNTVLNVIKTVSSIAFPLITFPYVSRVLGSESIGKVNFGLSILSYFTLLASLGIWGYATRECAAKRDNREELGKVASEIFSINICTTIFSYLLLAITLMIFKDLEEYRTLIIIQSTGILFATLGADWLNSAMEDFKFITIRTIAFQFISLILMFVFIKSQDDYLKYAMISIVSSSGSSITNILYRRRFCKVVFTFKMQVGEHIKPIMMMFAMLLAQTIFFSCDVTMLGLMKGDFEVGIYSTAFKIKWIIVQLVASICWVLMPRMSYYFEKNDWQNINVMLKKSLSVMVIIGFPCVVGVSVLSKEIILLVGGEEYLQSAIPLIILMISFLFDIFGGAFLGNVVCLSSKKEKDFMIACCIAAVINVILNYIFIPIGSYVAAAFTSGLSAIVICFWLMVKKDPRIVLNYCFSVTFSPIMGCIAILILCVWIQRTIDTFYLKVAISVLGSAFLYTLLLIVLKNEFVLDIIRKLYVKFNKKSSLN